MNKDNSINKLVTELYEYLHAEEHKNVYAHYISGCAMSTQGKGLTIFLVTNFPEEFIPIKEYKGIPVSYKISGEFKAL